MLFYTLMSKKRSCALNFELHLLDSYRSKFFSDWHMDFRHAINKTWSIVLDLKHRLVYSTWDASNNLKTGLDTSQSCKQTNLWLFAFYSQSGLSSITHICPILSTFKSCKSCKWEVKPKTLWYNMAQGYNRGWESDTCSVVTQGWINQEAPRQLMSFGKAQNSECRCQSINCMCFYQDLIKPSSVETVAPLLFKFHISIERLGAVLSLWPQQMILAELTHWSVAAT